MEQIFNPYLPLYEYIPDGEPHVFGGRLYVYGSHDFANGSSYCPGDYVVWSAPVHNLKNWKYHGVSYLRSQDPSNADNSLDLWAPDVARGPDGRYYLYYCYNWLPEIGVGVSDSPEGPFSFYGHVKYPETMFGGRDLNEHLPFDPAVLVDDDGKVYLYYGFAGFTDFPNFAPDDNESLTEEEAKKRDDVLEEMRRQMEEMLEGGMEPPKIPESSPGAMAVELEPDMLTVKEEPHMLIPGKASSKGTGYEGHAFFEASSIRKYNGKYYFVYSSELGHELCWSVSDRPLEGFRYGGILVSNGDIGLNGRQDPVNPLGNNHGGLVLIGNDYYIFYHRHTNSTQFSRQGCAEKIEMLPDGSFPQVEVTSCGLNGGPLEASGIYPAAICCHLTFPGLTAQTDFFMNPAARTYPRITEEVCGETEHEHVQYVSGICSGTKVGYKYFSYKGSCSVALTVRGCCTGTVTASTDEAAEDVIGKVQIGIDSEDWSAVSFPASPGNGIGALYFRFDGEGTMDLKEFSFS